MQRVVLVTGSTDGIGRAVALELGRRDLHVIVHGRDEQRAEDVARRIREAGGTATWTVADLSVQSQVRLLAGNVAEDFGRLHVLVNNAGIYAHRRHLTRDGVELTFAVNVVAPFLLTRELLHVLEGSAPSRVIFVSSVAHRAVDSIDFRNLQGERHYSAYAQYALTKLADIALAYEFAERLDPSHVTSNALHPGVISTKLLHAGFGFGGATVEEGARLPVYLATSDELDGVTGRYFADEHATLSAPLTYDHDVRERLWEECERLTGVPAGAG